MEDLIGDRCNTIFINSGALDKMIEDFSRILVHMWQLLMSVLMVVAIAFVRLDFHYRDWQNMDHRKRWFPSVIEVYLYNTGQYTPRNENSASRNTLPSACGPNYSGDPDT